MSTGPCTEDGKRKIRGNAVKHGLAGAGVALPGDLAAAVAAKVAAFVEALKPADEVQQGLVEGAALAASRLEFCRRQEFADLARRRRHAVDDWDARREAEVAEAAGRFKDDPASAIRDLRRTAAGCDWLLTRWDALAATIERRGCPEGDWDTAELCRLLGFRPEDEDGPFALLRQDALACLPADERALIDPERTRLLVEMSRKHLFNHHDDGTPLGPDEAPPRLLRHFEQLARSQMDELRTRRDRLWREVDEPDRREAPERCLVDVSKEGMNLRRYESGFARELHRDLGEVARQQVLAPPPPVEPEPTIYYDEHGRPLPIFDVDVEAVDEPTGDDAPDEPGARNKPTSAPPEPPALTRLSGWRAIEWVLAGVPMPPPDPAGGGWPA